MTQLRSRLAQTAMQIATFGLISTALGILGVQAGLVAPLTAFYMFALGAGLCGILSLIVGAIALFRTRKGFGPADRQNALIATGVGAALSVTLLMAGSAGGGLPPINDITTDLDSPPSFASAEHVPAYKDRDMSYPPEFVPQVRTAYADLVPIESILRAELAYPRALNSARSLGWGITYEAPEEGRFDASDTTAIFRFVDDITVRVKPTGTGSIIDIRSKSRDGRGDLGANADRIRAFTSHLGLTNAATR
jgi:uncharacterized protein (DUF1499 family)